MAQAKATASNGTGGPPAGFRRISALRSAPWWSVAAGNTLHAKVVDLFTMQTDPPRDYIQMELLAPSKVRTGKGDDAKVVDAAKGDIINVGLTYQLNALKDQVPVVRAGGEVHVWVAVKGKQKLEGGRTMWDLDVQVNNVRNATAPLRPLKAIVEAVETTDDTIPF